MTARLIAAVVLVLWAGAAPASGQVPSRERIRVERAGDLPRHTYPVPTTATALLHSDAEFAALAKRIEADLLSDLATYAIEDRATLKRYFGILSDLALERGDYARVVAFQDSIRAIEEKPSLRLVAGIVERAMAAASREPDHRLREAFRESFRREVRALPYAQVKPELTMLWQGAQVVGDSNALRLGENTLEQQVRDRSLSLEGAQLLVRMRATDRYRRVREDIVAVLGEAIAANANVDKADIWAVREVSLAGRAELRPVVIAIWDSGVDVALFPGQLFTNPREVPANGKDDDRNGYVDDVHGIAYDLAHERTTGVLGPLTLTPAQAGEYRSVLAGMSKLQNGMIADSEAQAFMRKAQSTPPAEFRVWLDGANQYDEYIHGTAVAGVALRDNPGARVLVARNSEDNRRQAPTSPTLELVRRHASELRETIDYFKHSGTRVVNMSWAYSPRHFEALLAASDAGGGPDGRRTLARQMFDTVATALRTAMESVPEILFVTGAANADADNRFREQIPASFELPNLITVGAVDRAGDQASFTSYGKVDVYASGVDVESVVPGGERVRWSGTSLAAPQVVNLAGKLFALKPRLTVAEARRAIIDASEEKTVGEGKRIRLLNPKAAVERLQAAAGSSSESPFQR